MNPVIRSAAMIVLVAVGACSARQAGSEHDHASPATVTTAGGDVAFQSPALPPSAAGSSARLLASPRHGEWAMIRTGPNDSVRAWVVWPSRNDRAPVVIVLHEIFGLSTWVRAVADHMAAEGYIAIAPDLLTGKAPLEGDTLPYNVATREIRTLQQPDIHRQLTEVAKYGMSLPAARPSYGIIGFCWGGGNAFNHAMYHPEGLKAAVVFYGPSPSPLTDVSKVGVPVLGLYGSKDARQTLNVPPTDSAMKANGKSYEGRVYDGAIHGFVRAQADPMPTGPSPDGPANVAAVADAWPRAIAFLRKNLGK
jgi:carboxymethylenebutenolidase